MTTREGWGLPSDKVRLMYSRHLFGEGVEIGPGHHPYVTQLPHTTVRYIDRWTPEEAKELFPELGDTAGFLVPDYVADLDDKRLSFLPDAGQDFVIASHVLEHVANPVAMLVDIYRVLKPGGATVVLLPDMRLTSDHVREPTPLEHVVAHYQDDVRQVDEVHLEEYARVVSRFTGEGQELKEYLARLALRSIHVHAWKEEDFFEVLEYAVANLGCRFEMLELVLAHDFYGSIEYGYVLRKSTSEAPTEILVERLRAQRNLLLKHRAAHSAGMASRDAVADAEVRKQLNALRGKLAVREKRIKALEARVARYEAWIAPVRKTPVYPALKLARRAAKKVQARRAAARA